MKSFIALVVCIGLVSVHGSSIIRQVLSDDHGRDNARDYTTFDDRGALIAKQILNKFLNKETLENVHQEKKQISQKQCKDSTCEICAIETCITATYKPETDSFDIIGRFDERSVFRTHIVVKPWSDCRRIKTEVTAFKSCSGIRNVAIMDGQVCVSVNLFDVQRVDNTVQTVCI